ncbi:hypothetical protein B0J14DRAFT_162982 [Halenospora varia]|nr:hypothetical protein B0J14DRAFT_162982 [Halenospora varia]
MDSSIQNLSDAKSSYHSSPLNSIMFVEDDLKLSSPSLAIVQKDVDLVERRIDETGEERPENLHLFLQETGFTFSVAMSQILTVAPQAFIDVHHRSIKEYFVSGFTVILPGLA